MAFAILFWPTFALYITLMYPVALLCNPSKIWNWVYRPVTKWLLFCLEYTAFIKYTIKNFDKIPSGQVIIGCNHQSTWETFIFSILFKELAIVIKKELLKKPIAGLYFKKLGCIPVNRASPVLAIKTILEAGEKACKAGKSILIFPNGTRANSGVNTEYKSGIYALYKNLGIPVIPVTVNSGQFWKKGTFKKEKGTISLIFREPIDPGLNKEDFFAQFEQNVQPQRHSQNEPQQQLLRACKQ
jgi:1-acyl-sn-glycerol-3-phosphate acyltransferase